MLNVLRRGADDKEATALLVLCHGVGADASQMDAVAESLVPRLPGFAFLCVDAPHVFDAFPIGRQWFSLRDRTPAVLDAGARAAAPALGATIDAELARLGLRNGRLAMAGFSQGAMMVLHAGLRRSEPPAAILAYSGALLDTPELAAEIAGHPPVLLVHGEADAVVPFTCGPQAEAALRRHGIPVQCCWRPGLGHSIDEAGLEAGLAFLHAALP